MTYGIRFTPESTEQLLAIQGYIAAADSPVIATRYTDSIITYCENLQTFPHRGTRRDDIRPGIRITNYKKRAVIAFEVDDERRQVSIIGIYYGGQDYETSLRSEQSVFDESADDR